VEPMSQANEQDCPRTSQTHEVAGVPLDFDSPRKSALAMVKAAVVSAGANGPRTAFEFAEWMFKAYPGLRSA
jgi:hypothetical protein